jgi:hypothetical protein
MTRCRTECPPNNRGQEKLSSLGVGTVVRGAIRSLKDAVAKIFVLFNLLNKMHEIFAY